MNIVNKVHPPYLLYHNLIRTIKEKKKILKKMIKFKRKNNKLNNYGSITKENNIQNNN